MSKKRILSILLILLTLISFCSIVIAESLEDLQNKKNELQNQITESNDQIEQIQIELTQNLEQLNNLNSKITTYENEIKDLDQNLKDVEQEIQAIEEKLNKITNSYNAQLKVAQKRIIALYEAGDIIYLDVLLNSDGMTDFIANYYLIGEVIKYDNQILENIEKQKAQIEQIKSTIEEKKESLQTIKKNKEKTTTALENSKIIRNSYINKLNSDEQQTQKIIDDCQAELDRIEAQIVIIATGNIGSDYIGGEFAWPAPGYTTITSRFGMRVHPILKVPRLHSGTDIAMPTGSYIIAANDGVVTHASYTTTGFGNMVMIDHGGGVVTLYGHGSEIIAQTGQTVKKGDIIMKAGSTRLVNRSTFTF